jgi:MFS family permease
VAPLLGIINEDIGPDPNYVWIALCYILTLAIGQVLGRLSDLFGRRWFFISGSALALGCIISAVATNIPMLIGGAVLVGLASDSQLSYVFVLGELILFKHRFLVMSYLFAWAVPFSGFGPALAYIFVQHTKHTWRSCYYLMIVVNTSAVICRVCS